MRPVFTNDAFELCTLSNPSGYPVSFTHAGIAYDKDGYGGYKYFLSQSPFPSANDSYENPCLYWANPRTGNLPPIDWTAYPNNPLAEDPGNGYNADPDIMFFDGSLYVMNRPYRRDLQYQWVDAYKVTPSNGGFAVGSPVKLFDTNTPPANFGYPISYMPTLASPAFIKYGDKIRSYHLVTNTSNDASQTRNMVIMEGTDFETPQNFSFLKYGSVFGRDLEPWHWDVFEHDGKLYAIVNCIVDYRPNNNYNFLAVSEDWENFRIYPRPLSSIWSYRSTAFVREDGMFILYLTTIGYKPAGNQTADGRNIVLAYRPWSEVLAIIEKSYD